jgi:hypothetical protein
MHVLPRMLGGDEEHLSELQRGTDAAPAPKVIIRLLPSTLLIGKYMALAIPS